MIHNMRKMIENFYPDSHMEHASFYSMLNKINNDSKTNPEVKTRIQNIKNSQNNEQTFTRPFNQV